LGSGLNALAESVTNADVIPYAELPNFPQPTVEGHTGQLVCDELEGRQIVVMQGRVHYYEGYTMQEVTFPIRVLHELGVKWLIITNAAGGINSAFRVGDLMVITDHLNLIGMAGLNPLRGPNDPTLGPRFPDMSQAYDPALRRLAHQVAKELGFSLQEGVYVCLAGPSFETPADLRFLRMIGVDAVGMSTVPEVNVARHMNMRVLGISAISNIVILEPAHGRGTTHEEVLEAGRQVAPRLTALLKGVVRRIAEA